MKIVMKPNEPPKLMPVSGVKLNVTHSRSVTRNLKHLWVRITVSYLRWHLFRIFTCVVRMPAFQNHTEYPVPAVPIHTRAAIYKHLCWYPDRTRGQSVFWLAAGILYGSAQFLIFLSACIQGEDTERVWVDGKVGIVERCLWASAMFFNMKTKLSILWWKVFCALSPYRMCNIHRWKIYIIPVHWISWTIITWDQKRPLLIRAEAKSIAVVRTVFTSFSTRSSFPAHEQQLAQKLTFSSFVAIDIKIFRLKV